jgi:integrase
VSVEKIKRRSGETVWRVRWRQDGRNRASTFSTRRDALDFDAEVRRTRRAGVLTSLDAGRESLGEYVTETWAPLHGVTLAPKTRRHYASLYDHHLRAYLGSVSLRDVTPEKVAGWQAERLRSGAGPVSTRHALDLLGSILEHAVHAERITTNPVRRVRKARLPRREEVRPLAPVTIEAMRAGLRARDATLISVMAYAGLRPGEALGLRWDDVGERTLLIQRSISLGEEADTKTRQHRTVRLLTSLAADLRAWRIASPRPRGHARFPWTQRATVVRACLSVLAPTKLRPCPDRRRRDRAGASI